MIQTPMSDTDFYERKIIRLEGDIAALHQELNIARTRLRTAEDFQIKYQLLLKQSNQQNMRLKQIEEREKQKFQNILQQQIGKVQEKWQNIMLDSEEECKRQNQEKINKLNEQIKELRHKNYEMNKKCEETDLIALKNRKLSKEIQNLYDTIQENRNNAERQRQEELRQCRESIQGKLKEKYGKDQSNYIHKITELQSECLQLSNKLKQKEIQEKVSDPPKSQKYEPQLIEKTLQSLNEQIQIKNNELADSFEEKKMIEEESRKQKAQLKDYIKTLENKVYQLAKESDIELHNLKNRMNQIRHAEIQEVKDQIRNKDQNHSEEQRRWEAILLQRGEQIERENKERQSNVNRLKQQKSRCLQKISELKDRLKYYEETKQIGETEKLINSLKETDNREDQMSNYENGITFLERQLKKATMKLQKKNLEVNNLTAQLNDVREEAEKEVSEFKAKYHDDRDYYNKKIDELEEKVKQLTAKMLKREREYKHAQNQMLGSVLKYNAEIKSLKNINNDLQRDYSRILESKKAIQKSYRDQRQRSVTSKSEVAVAKQQRFLELQRQKNDLQVIYKEREEQNKSVFDIELTEMKVERDHLKKENTILKQQNKMIREELEKKNPQHDKQNKIADYSKKLATLNLEIALTQNLYKTLVQAKSKPQEQIEQKQMSFQNDHLSPQSSIPEIVSQIQLHEDSQDPFQLDMESEREDKSPTFKFTGNHNENFMGMSFKPTEMDKD